jgi:hypothetical protein
MRDLGELKIIDGRVRRAGRPAPSDEIVRAFQSHYGIALPPDYLTLLRHANGGFPELDTISEWGVYRFYHLDHDRTSSYSLWAAMEAWQPILGCDALPIAEDSGGNHFFIDLKTVAAPVKICIHDDDIEIVDVAPSFQAFIDGLRMNPDYV